MAGDALPPPPPESGQLLIYQDGATRLQVRLDGQTVWLSQRLIAELYQVSVKTVNEHLANVYDEGELDPGATVRSFRIVQREGARDVVRAIEHYNLDAILKHEAGRRRPEAARPASDFDRAVEEVKRLEAGASGRKASSKEPAKKKPSRRRKPKGNEG